MGSSDNFCLRWNDFESNISTSFRELREDNEFFDVTLCCDNGVDLVQAHKVILAACSPLFRKILAHQRQQQNPFLYLKGIRLKELQAVLNFMYHGEVNVAQDSLNNFLAVAEELAVKGLTTDSQPGVSEARKKAVVKRKSVPHTPASNSGAKKAKSDDEDHHQELDVKRIKAEPEPSGSGQQAVMGDDGGIGHDDSYAGDDGADDFGDGEDFEGFAQYGDGQEFDESIAGASGSGGGDGKGNKGIRMGFRSCLPVEVTLEGFEDVSQERHSAVWKHFLVNKILDRVKCKHCDEMLTAFTSTMGRHLKTKHSIEVKSLRTDQPMK